jgi:hypothetical protein
VLDQVVQFAAPKEKHGLIVNEGFRFFCLGETDTGKTTLMRAVLYHTLAESYANWAFVHDSKGVFPEYPRSVMFPTVQHFRTRGFRDGDVPIASFRGAPRFGLEVEAEDVGALAKEVAQKGRELPGGTWTVNPGILEVEELAAASSDGRKQVRAPSVKWAVEQGRKVGLSTLGTTQSPRQLALDFYGQATAIAIFRVTGADANYLENAEFDPRMVDALRGQNNIGLPNHEFAIYVKGRPWDEEIHCLDARTASMFD